MKLNIATRTRESVLKADEQDYIRCFEENPLAMVIADSKSFRFLSVNRAAIQLYGYSQIEFMNLTLLDLVAKEDLLDLSIDSKILANCKLGKYWKHYRKGGSAIEVEILVQDVQFEGNRAKLLVVNNIEERLTAERALFASEERFSKVFHSSPAAVCITRLEDGSFIEANERFLKMTGYSRDYLTGRTEVNLGFWATLEERERFLDALIRHGKVQDIERAFPTKNRGLRKALFSAEVIGLGGCACLLVMLHDVTEARRNEQKIRSYERELRSLASQLSLAEEVERRRIASELHDHIGQNLAMLKIKLGVVTQTVRSSAARKELDKMRSVLEETLNSARSLCFELSPPVLYEVGFESAVEWLAERTQEEHGIQVQVVDDRKPKPLEDAVKVTLFTVVRELFANIVKHSHAKNAVVSLKREKQQIRITIKDNGIGFDVHTIHTSEKPAGFGLFSIRERINDLGGKVTISTHAGSGTQVQLIAPLKRQGMEKL